MIVVFELVTLFLIARGNSEIAFSNGFGKQETSTCKTNVVSHTFCEHDLPLEETIGKKTLEEVHTYAELKFDPKSDLPDSFTVCSTIMAGDCQSTFEPIFFNLLDDQLQQILVPYLLPSLKSQMGIHFSTWSAEPRYGRLPPWFPNHWTRSCLAINSATGSLDWVAEGTSIVSMKSEKLKDTLKIPKRLNGALILGALSYGSKWYSVSGKVTQMNIFSSYLSVEEMKSMTNNDKCAKKGDYLAWEDMEWVLHGKAKLETVDISEPCEGAPLGKPSLKKLSVHLTPHPDILILIFFPVQPPPPLF